VQREKKVRIMIQAQEGKPGDDVGLLLAEEHNVGRHGKMAPRAKCTVKSRTISVYNGFFTSDMSLFDRIWDLTVKGFFISHIPITILYVF
jgi:hypothetical protein